MARTGITASDIVAEKDDDKKWSQFGKLFETYAEIRTGGEEKKEGEAKRSGDLKITSKRIVAGAVKGSEGCTYTRDAEAVAKTKRRAEEVKRKKKRAHKLKEQGKEDEAEKEEIEAQMIWAKIREAEGKKNEKEKEAEQEKMDQQDEQNEDKMPTEEEARKMGWRQVAKRKAIIEIKERIYGNGNSTKKKKATPRTRKSLANCSNLSSTPEDEELKKLINRLEKEVQKKGDKAARRRAKKIKEEERKDWSKGGKKRYSWLRGKKTGDVAAMRTKEGQVITDTADMLKQAEEFWEGIYGGGKEIDVEAFVEKYGKYIKKVKAKRTPITAGRIKEAIDKMKKFQNLHDNTVAASDAFFPFSDNVQLAHKIGVKSLIQPGGSIRDDEVIDLANKLKISMIFTGTRHFKH